MARYQRPESNVSEIAERFDFWVRKYLQCNYSQLSKILNYANPSTLQAVKLKKVLPDFIRISNNLDKIKDPQGRKLNLHWLISGEGNPVVNEEKPKNLMILYKYSRVDDDKKKAILDQISKLLSS
ncbi:hypothetical protein LIS44_00925 [Acinetobacter haemolyticus]|nr:hypothetical protein LIS44_00925 [Acinetobacter haemolyticus]